MGVLRRRGPRRSLSRAPRDVPLGGRDPAGRAPRRNARHAGPPPPRAPLRRNHCAARGGPRPPPRSAPRWRRAPLRAPLPAQDGAGRELRARSALGPAALGASPPAPSLCWAVVEAGGRWGRAGPGWAGAAGGGQQGPVDGSLGGRRWVGSARSGAGRGGGRAEGSRSRSRRRRHGGGERPAAPPRRSPAAAKVAPHPEGERGIRRGDDLPQQQQQRGGRRADPLSEAGKEGRVRLCGTPAFPRGSEVLGEEWGEGWRLA